MRQDGVVAVASDLAGTSVDWGSRVPAKTAIVAFRRNGLNITLKEAGVDTGAGKLAYLKDIARRFSGRWEEFLGRPVSEADIRRVFSDFQAYLPDIIRDNGCSELIPPITDIARQFRELGIRIGVNTGYPSRAMQELLRLCRQQGFTPDAAVCSEDVPQERPAPDMIREVMNRLDVPDKEYHRVVAVGDTPKDMEAGRNAGVWTVGVVRTSSLVGLSRAQSREIENDEHLALLSEATERLKDAGAHFVVDGIWDLPDTIREIDGWIKYCRRP